MERHRVLNVEDDIDRAVEGLGEVDGHSFGQAEFVMYIYGPDADQLWEAVEPVLVRSGLPAGTTARRRYGPAQQVHVRVDDWKLE